MTFPSPKNAQTLYSIMFTDWFRTKQGSLWSLEMSSNFLFYVEFRTNRKRIKVIEREVEQKCSRNNPLTCITGKPASLGSAPPRGNTTDSYQQRTVSKNLECHAPGFNLSYRFVPISLFQPPVFIGKPRLLPPEQRENESSK